MAMNTCMLLCSLVVILLVVDANAQQWSGHVCSRRKCRYRTKRVCAYRFWGSCCWHKTIWEAYWVTEYFCCPGFSHSGDYNCNDPICIPVCQNNGTCSSPGKCQCPATHTGYRCTTAWCSYLSPCFPGTCHSGDQCQCDFGFRTDPPSDKANYCLKMEDLGAATDLLLTEMQVRMSYWPRSANPPMELHWILADSTQLAEGDMDIFWTNRRDFNRLETTCTSQYNPQLPDYPDYVSTAGFGIVNGSIEVWLSKLVHGSGLETEFTSLSKTIPCQESVSSTDPETSVFNCSIVDTNFDRFLEHLDALKIVFTSTGGGYRRLKNLNTGATYATQVYSGIDRMLAVEFRFDLLLPHHCEETGTCSGGQQMLKVPDITRTNPISIEWEGWVDDDSQMFRYAWEVFPMDKSLEGYLDIKLSHTLLPLINQEVLATEYTPQTYRLPGPGMYSVILEAGDRANNTKFVRRLVLYDPDPRITSDPQHGFYVSTASEVADYKYQTDVNGDVIVTWSNHFRNVRHEVESLLGGVREYPAQLQDGDTAEGAARYWKTIPYSSDLDDHEGERTVEAIANKRGIVNFAIQYDKDSIGGKNQPDIPIKTWINLDLNTRYTLPSDFSLTYADTVTVWVKATDVMGTQRVEKTRVSFDSTEPSVRRGIEFHMNVHVECIPFSSQFKVVTEDPESGIAFIVWTFTLTGNNAAFYRKTVPGRTECDDITQCSCTRTGECFNHEQIFSLSNCHMVMEKETLDTAIINVTADVTNMAGLVTTVIMLKDDLTKLNGTEAYYPPQNIAVKNITTSSVTLTWSFPPSCFARTGMWVIVNNVKHPVHKDAQDFALTGLSGGTSYTIAMVIDYVGNKQSEPASVNFITKEEPFPVEAT